MAERALTRAAGTFDVLISRRTGDTLPPGPADYGPWTLTTMLVPVSAETFLAPKVSRATFVLDLARAEAMPWQWPDRFSIDDRVAITDHVEGANAGDGRVYFVGFVADVDWSMAMTSGEVTVTAVSNAHRLARDAACLAFGRRMLSYAGDATDYSGLPLHFNAAGQPNCGALWNCPGGPARGVYLFTADDQLDARQWTLPDAMDYLQWLYNADETWCENYSFTAGEYASETAAVECNCNGMSLWQALAAVGAAGGWDVCERFYWKQVGGVWQPTSYLKFVKHHTGQVFTVSHQDRDAMGNLAPLDLNLTNLFTASVAESSTNCITRPLLLGGAELIEVGVVLKPAWDPDLLATPATGIVMPGAEKRYGARDYCRQYVAGGPLFPRYEDVGRLWDANTDGAYSAAPYNQPETDMAKVAQDALGVPADGTWPRMAYRPLPCISRVGEDAPVGATNSQFLVEISFDGGIWWQVLHDVQVLPDRLAVRITAPNLAAIMPDGVKHWNSADNLFARLVADKELEEPLVLVRLTCCVASPNRATYQPARTVNAGTRFWTAEAVERGTLGGKRSFAPSSGFAGDNNNWPDITHDVADGTAELAAAGEAIRDQTECRGIEAQLNLEWPDQTVDLAYVVPQIAGINYSLATDASRAPRIVAIGRRFRPDSYGMTLTLGTLRKSPSL